MKLFSLITLTALLSMTACSHMGKSCCKKDKAACCKEKGHCDKKGEGAESCHKDGKKEEVKKAAKKKS